MKVVVSGATGLVGGRLLPALCARGHSVSALTRDPERARSELPREVDALRWDARSAPPTAALEGADALIHLAGETVVGRWTRSKRAAIRDSRVLGTRTLVSACAALERPPALICASAMGYYGERGDAVLDEAASAGEGFLSEVCQAWEAEARAHAAREVRLRIGLVLDPRGGALEALLTPYRLALGGRLGSGRQWWSWIHADDLVRLIVWALETPEVAGPLNATAPEPVTQAEFARTLAAALGRPAWLPVPETALRLVLGGFSAELLTSRRVVPQAALDQGFEFEFTRLEGALADLLGPRARGGAHAPHPTA